MSAYASLNDLLEYFGISRTDFYRWMEPTKKVGKTTVKREHPFPPSGKDETESLNKNRWPLGIVFDWERQDWVRRGREHLLHLLEKQQAAFRVKLEERSMMKTLLRRSKAEREAVLAVAKKAKNSRAA